MSGLIVPGSARPSNLSLSAGTSARFITSDLYDICRRVQELDPDLYIVALDSEDPRPYRWVIMEKCHDGTDRMALRVREGELDGRVIAKLQEMLAVPLDARAAALERENEEWERKWKEDEADRLYESVGRPMWTELERCGFVQRGVSYPKQGVAQPARTK